MDGWKKSCRISVEIYKYFRDCKNFGFKDQITRSSLSIGSNIAEGMEKDSIKDTIRFLNIANGSFAEVITHLSKAFEIGYIEKAEYEELIIRLENLSKMIKTLINYRTENPTPKTQYPKKPIKETNEQSKI